jgi:hypothetical protein
MKFKLLLLLFPFYLLLNPTYNAWYAMNLKGEVEVLTEKTFEPMLKNEKWVKKAQQAPKFFLIYNFLKNGQGENFIMLSPDSLVKSKTIYNYDSEGNITGQRELSKNGSLQYGDVIMKADKNIIALEIKRYDDSNQLIQTIINRVDNDDNIVYTEIDDEGRKKHIRYESRVYYNKDRNPVMKIQSRAPEYRKDTTNIQYLKFDAKGNWIEKIERTHVTGVAPDFDLVLLIERNIKYY